MNATHPCPVFVVGAGRSGTTITASLLNRLPGVHVSKETGYIGLSIGMLERIDEPGVLSQLLLDVNSWLDRERWDHRADERGYRDFCQRSGLSGAEGFLHYVWQLDSTTPWPELRWIGDNTPLYVMAIPAIAKLLPDACFVHVVRDARDVACSVVRMRFGADDLTAAAMEWQTYISCWLLAERTIPAAQRVEIRYEDLCTNAEATLTKLAEFLGCTRADAQAALAAQSAVSNGAGPSASGFQSVAGMEHHRRLTESIGPSRVGRYRKELSDHQIRAIEAVAQNGLIAYGYPFGGWQSSPLMKEDRRALLAAMSRDMLRRAWKRVRSLGR